ncbi:MAG: arsinothricin resistance N-acetyltransferase ArsN1 family B [Betaproteobacteria bacterium]
MGSTSSGRAAHPALSLRLATGADAGQLAAIYRPLVVGTAISFETDPPDEDEMRRRVHETLQTLPWLVATAKDVVAGYAYATKHRTRASYRWSVETSVYVHEAFRRRGIASALYRALFRILVAQGYVNAYAGIALPNPASVASHEAVGFRHVGTYRRIGFKLGEWHDVGWWHLQLQPLPSPPPAPRTIAEMQADSAFGSLLLDRSQSTRGT